MKKPTAKKAAAKKLAKPASPPKKAIATKKVVVKKGATTVQQPVKQVMLKAKKAELPMVKQEKAMMTAAFAERTMLPNRLTKEEAQMRQARKSRPRKKGGYEMVKLSASKIKAMANRKEAPPTAAKY